MSYTLRKRSRMARDPPDLPDPPLDVVDVRVDKVIKPHTFSIPELWAEIDHSLPSSWSSIRRCQHPCVPGQWPESPPLSPTRSREAMHVETSIFTTVFKSIPTRAFQSIVSLPVNFYDRFFRRQRILARPVLRQDGFCRKKRLVDLGAERQPKDVVKPARWSRLPARSSRRSKKELDRLRRVMKGHSHRVLPGSWPDSPATSNDVSIADATYTATSDAISNADFGAPSHLTSSNAHFGAASNLTFSNVNVDTASNHTYSNAVFDTPSQTLNHQINNTLRNVTSNYPPESNIPTTTSNAVFTANAPSTTTSDFISNAVFGAPSQAFPLAYDSVFPNRHTKPLRNATRNYHLFLAEAPESRWSLNKNANAKATASAANTDATQTKEEMWYPSSAPFARAAHHALVDGEICTPYAQASGTRNSTSADARAGSFYTDLLVSKHHDDTFQAIQSGEDSTSTKSAATKSAQPLDGTYVTHARTSGTLDSTAANAQAEIFYKGSVVSKHHDEAFPALQLDESLSATKSAWSAQLVAPYEQEPAPSAIPLPNVSNIKSAKESAQPLRSLAATDIKAAGSVGSFSNSKSTSLKSALKKPAQHVNAAIHVPTTSQVFDDELSEMAIGKSAKRDQDQPRKKSVSFSFGTEASSQCGSSDKAPLDEAALQEVSISGELLDQLSGDFEKLLAAKTPKAVVPKKPLVSPLTQVEEDVLREIVISSDGGKKQDYEVVPNRIRVHDFSTLLPQMFSGDPRAWVNDTIIDEYIMILVNHVKKIQGYEHEKGGPPPPVHHFVSQWFPTMCKRPTAIKRWAARVNLEGLKLLGTRLLLIPICRGNHWTLLVIKPIDRELHLLDSLGGTGEWAFKKAREWLQMELEDGYVATEWVEVLDQHSTRQLNASDCGIFVLLNALCLLRGDEHRRVLAVDGMEDARKRVALTIFSRKVTTEW